MRDIVIFLAGVVLLAGAATVAANAQAPGPEVASVAPPEDAAALALKLSNPLASLISVPLQFNYDSNIGPARDGDRVTLNLQPVVPLRLNADWNLISRTILPVVWQSDIAPGTGSQFGLGDTVQSLFFSPAVPKGVIWGVGPVLLLPTGTDRLLTGGKWGGRPTGVVLKQAGAWTIGALANHIWSFAGNSSRSDISTTFVNPFVSHTSKSAFTYGLSVDIVYDWKNERWTVPGTVSVSQLTKVGSQLVSFGAGLRYYLATNDFSPHGVAGRVSVTLLFPKK